MTHRFFVIGHGDVPATSQPELTQVFGDCLQGYGRWIGMITGGTAGVAVGGPPLLGGVRGDVSFDESWPRGARDGQRGRPRPQVPPRMQNGRSGSIQQCQSTRAARVTAEARGDLRPTPGRGSRSNRQGALPTADALKPTVMERHAVERGDRQRMTPRARSVAVRGTTDGVVARTSGRVTLDTATSGNNGGSREKPQ